MPGLVRENRLHRRLPGANWHYALGGAGRGAAASNPAEDRVAIGGNSRQSDLGAHRINHTEVAARVAATDSGWRNAYGTSGSGDPVGRPRIDNDAIG